MRLDAEEEAEAEDNASPESAKPAPPVQAPPGGVGDEIDAETLVGGRSSLEDE
jgi:hypothetical protein